MRALFDRSSPLRLVALSLFLVGLWLWRGARPSLMTTEEAHLYRKVLAGQAYLWNALQKRGVPFDASEDIHRSGFIGTEWSPLTTTLGSLDSKRCSTDPLWAVQMLRWFDALKMAEGDRVAVFSSASFPGLLFSALAAAELRGLKVDLVVSLGASTWGANRPEAPWPVTAKVLAEGGFLVTRPRFYTLGGGGEVGGGLSEEGVFVLERAAGPVELFRPRTLADVTRRKMALIEGGHETGRAKLVIDIGGSASSRGSEFEALEPPPGIIFPGREGPYGDGVVARALKLGYPVLHLLNLRALAEKTGISFTSRSSFFSSDNAPASVVGVLVFVAVLATHKRWIWKE